MKLGTSISSVAHIGILLWGALSYQGVKKFEVAEVEALPVDFIPIESITRSIEGERDAKRAEKPSPKPTRKVPEVENAQNTGDTKIDVKSKVEATPSKKPVEVSAPPLQKEKPTPTPENDRDSNPDQAQKDTPVPTSQVAALNEAPQPVREEIKQEAPAKAEESEQFAKLPDDVPLPVSRPKPPQPKTAKTQQRKNPEDVQQKKKSASDKKNQSTEDQIAALLNKQDPSASGAKRSSKPASLGSKKTNGAEKLSRSEMDALRGAIEKCWNVPIGLSDAEDMRVTITMNLAKDGSIDGRVGVKASGGESRARRAFSESARRAVLKCAPYNLPNAKYDTWSQVVVNFDPSKMF